MLFGSLFCFCQQFLSLVLRQEMKNEMEPQQLVYRGRNAMLGFVTLVSPYCLNINTKTLAQFIKVKGDDVYVLDVKLAKTAAPKKALGPMARKHGESA
jgi:hypothetical protein